jgi:hypothetical protein
MANAPLNAPLGTNNLLALCLSKLADYKNYCDTGEPAVSTSANGTNYIVATGNVTAVCTFPLNGVGVQPTVSRGAYAIQFEGFSGTSIQIGPIVIEACDSTASNAGNVEVIDTIGTFPALTPGTIVREFETSLAAGSDVAIGTTATLKLANVVTLRAVCTVAGTINGIIKFVAAGTP